MERLVCLAVGYLFGIFQTGYIYGRVQDVYKRQLIAQLKDKELGEYLLLPINMFRSGETVFLDDLTAEDVEKALQVKIRIVKSDGQDFVHAILEPSSEPELEPMEEGLPGEEYGYEGYELDEIWEDEDDETE